MRRLALLVLLAACGKDTPAERAAEAERGCRAGYDRLQRWVQSHGRFPETPAEESEAIGGKRDPWGHPYTVDNKGGDVIVWSNGPDGIPGNEDDVSYPHVD